ncbi:hypothetical protein EYC84_000381 [Monilinia fructicola]|uniref:Uncharacterized protein n=1 Tax=Monilinia fructicola TaxID=38448 RepID=A0A5M9JRH0_MONFR|nr:hypothetical protein EYC84_000381 [Monilinia fructicola]
MRNQTTTPFTVGDSPIWLRQLDHNQERVYIGHVYHSNLWLWGSMEHATDRMINDRYTILKKNYDQISYYFISDLIINGSTSSLTLSQLQGEGSKKEGQKNRENIFLGSDGWIQWPSR